MKHKIFSILLTICLLALPFTTLGASIADPATDDAAWILNEDFGNNFTSDPLSCLNGRVVAHQATVENKTVLKAWGVDTVYTSYPIALKTLDTPISSGFIVYKAKFMIPGDTISDSYPVTSEVGYKGQVEFSVHNSVTGGYNDDHTLAVKFDAVNDSVYVYHNKSVGSSGGAQTYSGVTIDADAWNDVMMTIDMTNSRADVYLNGRRVVEGYTFTNGRSVSVIGCGVGQNTPLNAPAYIDDVKVFTASTLEFEPEEAQKIYKEVSDKEGVLGYYAYDDFEGYDVDKSKTYGTLYYNGTWDTVLNETERADSHAFTGNDRWEYVKNGDDGKYYYVQSKNAGRTFKLYTPLKESSGYAHMHVDVNMPEASEGIPVVGFSADEKNLNSPTGRNINRIQLHPDKITVLHTMTSNAFNATVPEINVPVDIKRGEWISVDILQDMSNKQWDIFINGVPVIVDLYFSNIEDNYVNGTVNAEALDYTFKSAYLGVVAATANGNGAEFDNVYVADVTGDYVANMFKSGYEKLLNENIVVIDGVNYLKDSFLLPYNGYAKGDDVNFNYSTTNSGISIYERHSFSPYDDMRVSVKDGGEGARGNFTVIIDKGGKETTLTVPMNVQPVLTASPGSATLSVSAFKVIGAVSANGIVAAEGYIKNVSETDASVDVLLAVYQGTQLKTVKIEKVIAKAGKLNAIKTEGLTLANDLPTGCTAKAFVWNLGTLKALTSLQ